MAKILQINVTANVGSHGRIAEEIGRFLIDQGHQSFISYGRSARRSRSELIKIGNSADQLFHLLKTRILDLHGLGSKSVTKSFIEHIKEIDPDIVHLHNIHGYYLNIKTLFDYLKWANLPVVWTFHDCWPFTGHCSYFDAIPCYKWKFGCSDCPLLNSYPASWIIDNSEDNYRLKKALFSSIEKLVIVSPSEWLSQYIKYSFLADFPIKTINNGVDIKHFNPDIHESVKAKYKLNNRYILGVASIWSDRKGLEDFKRLRLVLDPSIEILLVGLTRKQILSLPNGARGIERTESMNELASLYAGAEVFVNPTYIDNFPSVNLEALACGTPVVTYNTGGSIEAIDQDTGLSVQKGDIMGLNSGIENLLRVERKVIRANCRERAVNMYSSRIMSNSYLELYRELLS